MNETGTQWTPVLLVLGVALVAGALLVWRLRGLAPTPVAAVPLESRDLIGRRDALVQQLRDMHEMPDAWGDGRQVQQRLDLEIEAARVVLALEDQAPAPSVVVPPTTAAPAPDASAARGFLWGLGTTGAFALVLFLVSEQLEVRPEGGSVTGGFDPMAASGGNPAPASGDVDAALIRTRAALQRQDMMAVWTETQEILRVAPGHPQALSYQALVRLAMGQPDVAEKLLKDALATAPDYAEGYLHLALVYARTGRDADTDRVLADAERRFPEDAELIRRAGAEIRAVTADAGDGPAPSTPPVPVTTPAAPVAAPASADGVSGTVTFAGPLPPGAVLFVSARAAGQAGGPPVAVKRLTPSAFPVSFTLGQADSMMGQALPPRLRLEARLDTDGNPLTRPPSDPSALHDDVPLGSSGLSLVLAPR